MVDYLRVSLFRQTKGANLTALNAESGISDRRGVGGNMKKYEYFLLRNTGIVSASELLSEGSMRKRPVYNDLAGLRIIRTNCARAEVVKNGTTGTKIEEGSFACKTRINIQSI
ncbi:hypothetical protein BH10ACI2_BH10ACI2_22870 [soil metagenome]